MKDSNLSPELFAYLSQHQVSLHPALVRLAEETQKRPDANMQISVSQGVFMNQLAKLISARRILEIGCFTGYSAICMGLALPEDGRLISCDINPETAAVARRYIKESGLSEKIDIRLAPALQTLASLREEKQIFDMMFIDADKENYGAYYEACLPLLRSNGLLLADNVFWGGAIADPTNKDVPTLALRSFNETIRRDRRVESSMIPIADGLYMIRKL